MLGVAMSSNKKKVKKKLSKKTKKALRGLVYAVLTVFILSCVVLVTYGIYFLGHDARFNIAKINVTECVNYTYEDIVEISNLVDTTNIFQLSKADLIKNISSLPYVENVSVSKKLPDTLNIQITERTGKYVAYAKDSGEYIKLDSSGYILEKVESQNIAEDMLLFGINFDDEIELGSQITQMEQSKLTLFEKIHQIYEKYEIEFKITSVEFKSTNVILCLNDKLNVILKDTNELEYKISFLKTILKELEGKSGTLDMTQDNPTYSAI